MSNHRNQSSIVPFFVSSYGTVRQSQALQSLRQSQAGNTFSGILTLLRTSFLSKIESQQEIPLLEFYIIYMRLARKIFYSSFSPDCEFNRFSLVRGHPVGISLRRSLCIFRISFRLFLRHLSGTLP